MGIKRRIALGFLATLLSACAEGHCRRPASPPEDKISADMEASSKASDSQRQGSVFVFKYDGSLQCQAGKGISLETMAKELKGLTVLSSNKKSDGLMHIQVCGSITGMANVYEIPATQLKKAETLGFKKWTFE